MNDCEGELRKMRLFWGYDGVLVFWCFGIGLVPIKPINPKPSSTSFQ